MNISARTGSDAWLEVAGLLLHTQAGAAPRGLATRELRNVTITIFDPDEVHVLRTTRDPSRRIATTEAMQLLAGTSNLEQLDRASGDRFSQFADAGRLRGAYGPRTYHQVPSVIARLLDDPDSRQAVVTVWRPDDLRYASRDVPCTLSWQFFIRDGALEMRVIMRSNDVWLGLPYDLEANSIVHRALAAALGVAPGPYTHVVGSMHLYGSNYERALAVHDRGVIEPTLETITVPRSQYEPATPIQAWMGTVQSAMNAVIWPIGDDQRWIPMMPDGAKLCAQCRYIIVGGCKECPAPMVDVPAGELLLCWPRSSSWPWARPGHSACWCTLSSAVRSPGRAYLPMRLSTLSARGVVAASRESSQRVALAKWAGGV